MNAQFADWAKTFLASAEPLQDPLDKIFLSMLANEYEHKPVRSLSVTEDPFDDLREFAQSQSHKLALNMSEYTTDFLVTCLCSDWYDVLMFISVLSYVCHTQHIDTLTLPRIAQVFPKGFPTKPKLRYLWTLQRTGDLEHRNLLEALHPCDFA